MTPVAATPCPQNSSCWRCLLFYLFSTDCSPPSTTTITPAMRFFPTSANDRITTAVQTLKLIPRVLPIPCICIKIIYHCHTKLHLLLMSYGTPFSNGTVFIRCYEFCSFQPYFLMTCTKLPCPRTTLLYIQERPLKPKKSYPPTMHSTYFNCNMLLHLLRKKQSAFHHDFFCSWAMPMMHHLHNYTATSARQ